MLLTCALLTVATGPSQAAPAALPDVDVVLIAEIQDTTGWLALHQEVGNRQGEAETWDSIGFAHHHLHEYGEAIDCYRRALDLFELTGDRDFQADTLHHLGDSRLAAGDVEAARDAWRRSLAIFDSVEHSDADRVRDKLAATPDPGDPAA